MQLIRRRSLKSSPSRSDIVYWTWRRVQAGRESLARCRTVCSRSWNTSRRGAACLTQLYPYPWTLILCPTLFAPEVQGSKPVRGKTNRYSVSAPSALTQAPLGSVEIPSFREALQYQGTERINRLHLISIRDRRGGKRRFQSRTGGMNADRWPPLNIPAPSNTESYCSQPPTSPWCHTLKCLLSYPGRPH